MHVEKSNNIELFKLTNARDWADIMISEQYQSGRITIASSFGTWSHYWGSCGEDFKTFLADMDIHYAATKFKCANEFDIDKTIKHFADNIESIFDDRPQKKDAILADLKELSDCNDSAQFWIIMGQYRRVLDVAEYYELSTQYSISKEFAEFWKVFWIPFFAEIKNGASVLIS